MILTMWTWRSQKKRRGPEGLRLNFVSYIHYIKSGGVVRHKLELYIRNGMRGLEGKGGILGLDKIFPVFGKRVGFGE